ncbi:MAG: acyl carrier protein [Gammaproteobacteria bacterium]
MAVSYDEVLMRLHRHLQQFAGDKIKPDEDTDLIEGLGLDSNRVLDLIMEVEDEFDISIPMNLLVDVHTVGDLARKIHELGPAD